MHERRVLCDGEQSRSMWSRNGKEREGQQRGTSINVHSKLLPLYLGRGRTKHFVHPSTQFEAYCTQNTTQDRTKASFTVNHDIDQGVAEH